LEIHLQETAERAVYKSGLLHRELEVEYELANRVSLRAEHQNHDPLKNNKQFSDGMVEFEAGDCRHQWGVC
jgi:hypothetical protein